MKSFLPLLWVVSLAAWSQNGNPPFQQAELLGRPEAGSVTVHLVLGQDLDLYVEYGSRPGEYDASTAPVSGSARIPTEVKLEGLAADAAYYYRVRYRAVGEQDFLAGEERTFHTHRPRGSTFVFTVEADPHLDENTDPETFRITLANQLAAKPDFMIDLGDNMMSDKLGRNPPYEQVLDRHLLLRSYYGLVCHSMPLFLVLGNHEGEWSSMGNGTEESLPVWATRLRKMYFPNPAPDQFYSGNSTEAPFVGLRQNYFSWEWGDALFVVIDPYWNVTADAERRGDWALTLGKEQYDWLKMVLETSTAKFKFVFGHNLVGGVDRDGKMRGGVEAAKFLEWGGYNLDGTWGFSEARPGWAMPIHELLVRNRVAAFFHGHDHIYARQSLDGVVYHEVPQPGAKSFALGNKAEVYGYLEGDILGGTGYLRITVSPDEANVEYVLTRKPATETPEHPNGEVVHSYTLKASDYQPAASDAARAFSRAPIAAAVVVPSRQRRGRRARE